MSSVDSIKNTIIVAFLVCFVLAFLVSFTAVKLQPQQEQNKKLDRIKNIVTVADLYKEGADVEQIFKDNFVAEVIELKTGKILPEKERTGLLDPDLFDLKEISKNFKFTTNLTSDEDIAGISRKPKYMLIYLLKENESIEKLVLPIYGRGLWSTLYGFIAIDKDFRTVNGITFYEHGETPGLGGEVDNPKWKEQWNGKLIYDKDWNLKIEVIKGQVDTTKEGAKYKVDGISGSTKTTRGVHNLIQFWLGEQGYKPYFEKLRKDIKNG